MQPKLCGQVSVQQSILHKKDNRHKEHLKQIHLLKVENQKPVKEKAAIENEVGDQRLKLWCVRKSFTWRRKNSQNTFQEVERVKYVQEQMLIQAE